MTNYRMKYFKIIYANWLKFLKAFGNLQMFILLTIIYFLFMPLLWIFLRLLSDPLSVKNSLTQWKYIKKRKFDYQYFKLQG